MTGTSRRITHLGLAALVVGLVVSCATAGPGATTVSPSQPTGEPRPSATRTRAPTATPVAPSDLRSGWKEYREPEDGFAIALPDSWHKVDVNPELLTVALKALSLHHPGLIAMRPAGARTSVPAAIRFFAFDWDPASMGSGFVTNLNVLRSPLTGPCTLAQFGRDNVCELDKVARVVKPVEEASLILPAGPALRLRYQLALGKHEGHDLSLSLTQFLMVRGQEGYVITFSTLPALQEKYEPLFDQIGRSFRWLDAESTSP